MRRFGSFLAGFLLALGVLVVLALGPGRQAGLLPPLSLPWDGAAPTPPPAIAEAIPQPAVDTAPEQPAEERLLVWQRLHADDLSCDRLTVDADLEVHYGPCDGGQSLVQLNEYQFSLLKHYLTRFQPFEYGVRAEVGTVQETTVTCSVASVGAIEAEPAEQAEIVDWIGEVYDQLAMQDWQDELLAHCRADLALALGLSMEGIRVAEVRAVRWPDACLGLHTAGQFCAEVVTPGYRVLLQAGGEQYEYRTDGYDQLRSTRGFAGAYLLPAVGD